MLWEKSPELDSVTASDSVVWFGTGRRAETDWLSLPGGISNGGSCGADLGLMGLTIALRPLAPFQGSRAGGM